MPGREPWIKVKIGIFDSEKLAALPDDSARWGYGKLLAKAKTQRRMGVFVSRSHVEDVVGRHAVYFEAWLGVDLVHIAPGLCADCAARHAPDQLKVGEVVVHDYLREQRDPTMPDRVDNLRRLQAAIQALEEAGIPVPFTDSVTANVTLHAVTPVHRNGAAAAPRPTPSPAKRVTAHSVTAAPPEHEPEPVTADVTPDVTPHSRARGMTVTETTTETTTTKENVSDGEVEAKAVPTRELDVDPDPFLSDPVRLSRPRASMEPIRPPARLEAITPKWKTPPGPCLKYATHGNSIRIEDGLAVCDICTAEWLAASVPVNGAETPQKGLGL